MARKRLADAGTSKLAARATQPAETASTEEDNARPAIAARRTPPATPRSFRLRGADVDRLRRVAERVSEEAGRSVSDSDIVRGLIQLGDKTASKKLLGAIKDALFET